MAKEKFVYHTYMNNPPEKVEWLGDDEFEIVVGTKRYYYNDMMDNAAQGIIRKVKFHLKKDGSICEATDLKGEDLYLTDEEEMKLNIIIHNIDDFFDNHDFSPEAFCIFLRYLMRPLSLTDKISAKRNVRKEKKY